MRRTLRIVAWVVGALVLVVVALAIAVPLLFDLNDHKDRIAAEVEARTGRELTIEGDLELTVFPWLGVRTGAMALAQPDGFTADGPFAAFRGANVRVKLLPLVFRREIEVDRVSLDGLEVNLGRDADGRDNWSDIADRMQQDAPAQPAETPDGGGFDLDSLSVAGVSVTGARATFRDAQAGASYTVEELDFETGAIVVGEPIELSLSARVASGVPQLRGTVAFDGRVDYDADGGAVAARIERASADLEGGVLPVARLRATLTGEVSGNLEQETWSAEGFVLELVARGGQLPDSDIAATVRGGVTADLKAQTAQLTALTLDAVGVHAAVTGSATKIVDAPSFKGRVELTPFSPRVVLAELGREDLVPETADPSALGHFAFAAEVAATEKSATLTNLDLTLDASRVTGRVAVADFEKQALRFDIALDAIDLDRYLPPETPAAEQVEAGALDDIPVPAELIRGLDLDGKLVIGALDVVGLKSRDIAATVKAQGGLLRVNPASAKLYGGTYAGDVSVDARGDVPRVSMDERLRGVQAGPLFDDLFGEARITGVADLRAQLTAAGSTIGEMRPTLNGNVSFGFANGAFQGFDLWHLLRDARAVLRNQPRPEHDGVQQTEFGSVSGSGRVRDGVLENDNLRAELPFMVVTGAGKLDLVQETVDYSLKVQVLDRPGVDDAVAMKELAGRSIPFRISGPIAEPAYRVDIAEALKDEVERRARDALEDRLREGLRRIIP